ncbi:MAG: 30S ribosomal protein S16 [Candidatus Latescibacterota bacterium]|nr:MAG: 30S ribosomal protein S16 [Candidatus Latescibacterota bacterium]
MPVRIRLRRMGRKKKPFYRIVVVDSRNPRDGKYIESLGHYNPLTEPAEVRIDEEKAFSWLQRGAVPSDTALSLLKKVGVLKKWHEKQKRAALIKALSTDENIGTAESTKESAAQPGVSEEEQEQQVD